MDSKARQIIDSIKKTISRIRRRQIITPPNTKKTRKKLARIEHKLASKLFPGQGFFSDHKFFALVVPIYAEITEIEIAVEAPEKQILNLDQLDIIGSDGKTLNKRTIILEATLSSYYKNKTENDLLKCVQTGQGIIHSQRESRPWLRLKLAGTYYIQSVIINNRTGDCGRRSQFLVVNTFSGNNKITEYINCSIEKAKKLLQEVCDATNISLNDKKDISKLLKKLKKSIKKSIENGSLDWDAKKLFQLLPIYEDKPDVDSFHEFIISIIFLKQLGTKEYIRIEAFKPLSKFLNSDRTIQKVLKQASDLSRSLLGIDSDIFLSKHSINRSILRQNRDEYLSAIQQAIDLFKTLEIDLVLCYGTLLGAVRDDDFIAHDDDVDLLMINDAKSEEEALEKRDWIFKQLRKRNLKVVPKPEHFHVEIGENNLKLDIFDSWSNDGKFTLMMERHTMREIPSDILIPVSRVKFRGLIFPAPAKPEEFLKDRYGENWNQPDPYHEFPWKVKL